MPPFGDNTGFCPPQQQGYGQRAAQQQWQQQQPSPVLMLRSVPAGTTEKDLEMWANQYDYLHPQEGLKRTKAVKSLLLTEKDIGFVQMQDIFEAQFIMDKYNTNPEQIMMRRPDGTMQGLNLVFSDKQDIKAQTRVRNQIPTSQTRILLVVLKNLTATIMMDELFWIFSQFGTVEKLSSFTKNMKNQVLVQYQTQDQASLAMAYLNGKEIKFSSPNANAGNEASKPDGTCQLAIVPSKLPELTFKNQDQKNRDYQQINDQLRHAFLQARLGQADLKVVLHQLGTQWSWRIRDFLWGVWVLGEGWCDPQQDKKYQGQIPVDPASQGKGIPEGQVGDCVHVQGIPVTGSNVSSSCDAGTKAFSPRMLWRVFGMYGEILAVKMLWKYPGTALVQFKDPKYAQQAREHLDRGLFGKNLRIERSNCPNAQHWSGAGTELQERMCTIASAKPPHVPPTFLIARPSDTLLVFDLVDGVTKEELLEVFRTQGRSEGGDYGQVVDVELAADGGRATVQFADIDNAAFAAAQLNGEMVYLPSQSKGGVAGQPNTRLNLHFGKKHPQATRSPSMAHSVAAAGGLSVGQDSGLMPPPPPPPPGQVTNIDAVAGFVPPQYPQMVNISQCAQSPPEGRHFLDGKNWTC